MSPLSEEWPDLPEGVKPAGGSSSRWTVGELLDVIAEQQARIAELEEHRQELLQEIRELSEEVGRAAW